MSSRLFFIIVFAISILLISIPIGIYVSSIVKTFPQTYDCIILTMFWTPTSCETKYYKNYECYQTIKNLSIDKYFTIHGVWPSNKTGIIPPDCNKDVDEFVTPNFDSDPELKDKLEHYWPGLYTNNTYLWGHEYNKHGYCYMKRNYLNFLDDYKMYFEKSVNLFEQGYRDLMEDILPDSRGVYNVSKAKFRNMLKYSKLKLTDYETYALKCDKKTNLLKEIYFIFDLNYNRIRQDTHQENCPDYFLVNFTDETKMPVWDKYEYYVFAVKYSPNTCVFLNSDECYKELKKKEFYKTNIHGLWPSYKSGIVPQDCNIGEDIEIKTEENKDYFENYFEKYWYSQYGSENYFFTHEYNKHGYCYNKRIGENLENYYIYFNKTLEIFNKYNFMNIFNSTVDGLSPGEYLIEKSDLISELSKTYPKDSFAFNCRNINGKIYLEEVYFKLDFDFKITSDGYLDDPCEGHNFWIKVMEYP